MDEWKKVVFSFIDKAGFSYIALIIALLVVMFTTCIYCCYHMIRLRVQKKTKVLGRVRDITSHVGGRKKVFWADPFRLSNLDYQRRFEDELTKLLYIMGTEVVLPISETFGIAFQDYEGGRSEKFILDYRWILKHFFHNAREYSFLLTGTKDQRRKDSVIRYNSSPLERSDLMKTLKISKGPPYKVEVIASIGYHIRNLCDLLKVTANKRSHGIYLQEEQETGGNDISSRARQAIMDSMENGIALVELIKALIPSVSKAMKDHYHNVVAIQRLFIDEHIPYADLSRHNRRVFKHMDHDTRKEVIMATMEDIMTYGYSDDVWEVMAVAVLPRFRYQLEH